MILQVAKDIKKCTGCGMCAEICPNQCIVIDYNSDGFLYPKITKACVECGVCVERCPANNPVYGEEIKEAFAASSKNQDELHSGCSSGGIAFECSKWMLSQDGIVFGARFAEDYMTVYHCAATEKKDVELFKGSKYIQSETRDSFSLAKQYLENGCKVLYIGTPCQIAGLKAYLNVEYDSLFTIDLMCHGVMSTRLYREYLESLNLKLPIIDINFRGKERGYNLNCQFIITDVAEKKITVPWLESQLGFAFANNFISRVSCSTCSYANTNRTGDITLADFINKSNTAYECENGASLIAVNTEKGEKMVEGIAADVFSRPVDLGIVRKLLHFRTPPVKHKNRDLLFENIDRMSFAELGKQFFCKYEPAEIP